MGRSRKAKEEPSIGTLLTQSAVWSSNGSAKAAKRNCLLGMKSPVALGALLNENPLPLLQKTSSGCCSYYVVAQSAFLQRYEQAFFGVYVGF